MALKHKYADSYPQVIPYSACFSPVDVDASFGEHEEPEIHVALPLDEGGHGVVDEHAAVGQPQRREYSNHGDQHLHHLTTTTSSRYTVELETKVHTPHKG